MVLKRFLFNKMEEPLSKMEHLCVPFQGGDGGA